MSNKCKQQQTMFETEGPVTRDSGPVSCLGMTFESDEGRHAYFLNKLAEWLRDPEFRKIEGSPIGSDEDILALSERESDWQFCYAPLPVGYAER